MEPQSIFERRSGLIQVALIVGSLTIGYLLVEAMYRWYLYRHYTVQASYLVMTTDVRPATTTYGLPGSIFGPFRGGKPYTLTVYAPDGTMFDRHLVRINNLGWVSQYNYSRKKDPSEYRIAIVGDSYTAGVNNSAPWPDTLQRKLNADHQLLASLGVKKISVLNLGLPGASLGAMAQLSVIARRFSPDMLIVNFIIEDLPRAYADNFDKVFPEPAILPNDTLDSEKEITPYHIMVDGVEVPIGCSSQPEDLSNPDCKVSVMWYVPNNLVFDKNSINHIRQHAAKEIVWHRVALSTKPLALLALLGRPIIQQGTTSLPLPRVISEKKDEDERIMAIRAMKFIRTLNQNVLILHNPTYPHMTGKTYVPDVTLASWLDPLIRDAKKSGIDIVRMDQYMPVDKGDQEWRHWYNLPYDGHWSNYGAEIYAAAVYKVAHQHLLANKQ